VSDDFLFWETLDQLISRHEIKIDRPKGSAHPTFPDKIYPLDYGYLDGTTSGDGQGIDVWMGTRGYKTVDAIACTIDLFKRDTELKLLLGCTEEDIQTISMFLNDSDLMRCMIVKRTQYTPTS
jgi:inorganic pyrophosphatase